MPFLPFVLLLAWQALSKSASFALGWATSLFFGYVPGSKGRILSIMALVSAAWVVLVLGFGVPIALGWVAERLGWVGRNFDLAWYQTWGLVAAIILTPPAVSGLAEIAGFEEPRSVRRWASRIPVAYPGTASLGVAVLLMVGITPFLVLQRMRRKRVVLPIPLVLRQGTDDASVTDAIVEALEAAEVGHFERQTLTGPRSWPLRTMAFAARHLLGSVVRGEPDRMIADEMEVMSFATNIAILGPQEPAHRARAAIARRLAISDAYLTWSPDSQELEDLLAEMRDRQAGGAGIEDELERFRERLDGSSLNSDEWNTLERLRLQLAQASDSNAPAPGGDDDEAADRQPEVSIAAR